MVSIVPERDEIGEGWRRSAEGLARSALKLSSNLLQPSKTSSKVEHLSRCLRRQQLRKQEVCHLSLSSLGWRVVLLGGSVESGSYNLTRISDYRNPGTCYRRSDGPDLNTKFKFTYSKRGKMSDRIVQTNLIVAQIQILIMY